MASLGTSEPSAPDTFWYRMRAPLRLSIWLNDTVLRDTALKSFTGMLTSPKLIDPLQIALGIPKVYFRTSDDTTVRSPAGQFVPRGELQLAQDGGHVRLDRLHRDLESTGD